MSTGTTRCEHDRQPGMPCAEPACPEGIFAEFWIDHFRDGREMRRWQRFIFEFADGRRAVYWQSVDVRGVRP